MDKLAQMTLERDAALATAEAWRRYAQAMAERAGVKVKLVSSVPLPPKHVARAPNP